MTDELKRQIRAKIQEANIALYRNQSTLAHEALKEASFLSGTASIEEIKQANQ
jgi:hypothetical protein